MSQKDTLSPPPIYRKSRASIQLGDKFIIPQQESILELDIKRFRVMEKYEKLDEIIRILKISKQFRTTKQIEILQEFMMQFRFFKDLKGQISDNIYTQLFYEMTYKHFTKQSLVFFLGDIGRHMYLILQGEVAILLPKENYEITTSSHTKKKQKKQQSQQQVQQNSQKIPTSQSNDIQEVLSTEQKLSDSEGSPKSPINRRKFLQKKKSVQDLMLEYDKKNQEFMQVCETTYPLMKVVNIISEGSHFGEVALENRVPRTATVFTKTECSLVVISYESFSKIKNMHYQQMREQRVQFLKQIPLFNDWSMAGLYIIYNNCEKIELPLNQIIYKEGDIANYIYFIIEGEVDLYQPLEINKVDLQEQKKLLDLELFNKPRPSQMVPILSITNKGMFGEIELTNFFIVNQGQIKKNQSLPLRYTRVQCRSNCTLLRYNAFLFLENYKQFSTVQHMKSAETWKHNNRKNLLKKNQQLSNIFINEMQISNKEKNQQNINQAEDLLELTQYKEFEKKQFFAKFEQSSSLFRSRFKKKQSIMQQQKQDANASPSNFENINNKNLISQIIDESYKPLKIFQAVPTKKQSLMIQHLTKKFGKPQTPTSLKNNPEEYKKEIYGMQLNYFNDRLIEFKVEEQKKKQEKKIKEENYNKEQQELYRMKRASWNHLYLKKSQSQHNLATLQSQGEEKHQDEKMGFSQLRYSQYSNFNQSNNFQQQQQQNKQQISQLQKKQLQQSQDEQRNSLTSFQKYRLDQQHPKESMGLFNIHASHFSDYIAFHKGSQSLRHNNSNDQKVSIKIKSFLSSGCNLDAILSPRNTSRMLSPGSRNNENSIELNLKNLQSPINLKQILTSRSVNFKQQQSN